MRGTESVKSKLNFNAIDIMKLSTCFNSDVDHCDHINITLKVNLYFNEHFNGEEEYSYVDKPQLNFDNRALSLIGERLVDEKLPKLAG